MKKGTGNLGVEDEGDAIDAGNAIDTVWFLPLLSPEFSPHSLGFS